MGAWSAIGSLARNTLKIGGGYMVGNAIRDKVSQSENDAFSGMAGLSGIAGAYILPAAGSRLFSFVGDRFKGDSSESSGKAKTSCWKSIGKAAAFGAGALFAGDQVMKWYNDHLEATSNVHMPSENEYLQTGSTATRQRTGEEALTDIQTVPENPEDGLEMP